MRITTLKNSCVPEPYKYSFTSMAARESDNLESLHGKTLKGKKQGVLQVLNT